HFGTQLQETLNVPIGLIRNAWGGSACDAWVPLDRLEGDELYGLSLARWKKAEAEFDEAALRADHQAKLDAFYAARDAAYAAGDALPARPWVANKLFHQHRPANLFNARVLPLVPFAIKGVIWYQGESNASRAYQYREMFPLMIQSWREVWGQGDFPFYWVQLADFKAEADGPESSPWAELREAQTMTLDRLPNVGEAVTIDIGEANDIHPRNKRDVGLRLARLALAKTYGKSLKAESPRFDSMDIADGVATVSFSGVGQGLKTYDGVAPTGFTIAGEDRVFHPATAEIVDKNRIAVSSPAVTEPAAVRYAWAWNPVVNLYDSAWLPVTPFRTDDWPGVTINAR
ncbi:MAG: sialate O-acetylesterase, partial [Planctomycetota bacterium]